MKRITPLRRTALLCGLLLTLLCTVGCYKDDGSVPYIPHNNHVGELKEDSYADEKDAMISDVSEDVNAQHDYPFALDAGSVSEPRQDIVLIMIYEEFGFTHTQTVNYYDKNGLAYRYRQPLDTTDDDDWYELLAAHRQSAKPVNQMSDAERVTLWYLANHADAYDDAKFCTQKSPKEVLGERHVYVVDDDREPVELFCYAETVTCRDLAEVKSFADWFRYFYRSDFEFSTMH